jgi:hypothetical protein
MAAMKRQTVRNLWAIDNLEGLARLGDESVSLVYLDPPFNSGRPYEAIVSRSWAPASLPFLEALARGRRPIAVGRLAARVTAAPYVRHPAHGGAAQFPAGLVDVLLSRG